VEDPGRDIQVVFAIDDLQSGGAQRQAVELAVSLVRDHGVHVEFLVYRHVDFFADRLRDVGIPITAVPKHAKFDLLYPRRIRAWLRDRPEVDVLHGFMLVPSLWAWLAWRGLPRASRPAFVASERSNGVPTSRLEWVAQRLAFRGCDALTANSRPVAESLRWLRPGPEHEVHYLPNGIDLADWDRSAVGASPVELEPGRFHVGVVGRLDPAKGQDVLIEALIRIGPAELEGWRVYLVGAIARNQTAFVAALQDRIRASGLEGIVQLLPPVPRVAALVRQLDLVVLPSRLEGFPNAVLEAMASRVPVVAAAVGDVPELLAEGTNGVLCPPGDADALAGALRRIRALSGAARAEMAERARRTVEERYEMRWISKRYLELYRSLLARAAVVPE
jgi:glycosyltransferase involved in cell wall biosynthesis